MEEIYTQENEKQTIISMQHNPTLQRTSHHPTKHTAISRQKKKKRQFTPPVSIFRTRGSNTIWTRASDREVRVLSCLLQTQGKPGGNGNKLLWYAYSSYPHPTPSPPSPFQVIPTHLKYQQSNSVFPLSYYPNFQRYSGLEIIPK